MDTLTPEQRSWNMSRIRSRNTRIEFIIRSALHKRGFRFRINQSCLPGKPDIVLKKYRAIIFINGCFWHFHECKYSKIPSTRHEWWENKLKCNRKRDMNNIKELELLGWRTLIIWECMIRESNDIANLIDFVESWLLLGEASTEIGLVEK